MSPPHANDQYLSGSTYPPNWIPVVEKPVHTPKRLRIVTVGAGYSGLMLTYKIREQFKYGDFMDHVIYEKNVGTPEATSHNCLIISSIARYWGNVA